MTDEAAAGDTARAFIAIAGREGPLTMRTIALLRIS